MKEVFSAFGNEVFRPLVTLVLPGAIAIVPYFIALMQKEQRFWESVSANHTETALMLALASLFWGMVIEDVGTRFEAKILDERAKRANKDFLQVWYDYLRCVFPTEPPGRRFLRALVLRLKFELGAAVALIVAIPGVLLAVELPIHWRLWISGGAVVLALYLGWIEAPATHEVLSKLRAELIRPRPNISAD